MIERYTLPEMGRVWSEAHKYELWCAVEVMVLEAHAEAGTVPASSVEPVKKAGPDVPWPNVSVRTVCRIPRQISCGAVREEDEDDMTDRSYRGGLTRDSAIVSPRIVPFRFGVDASVGWRESSRRRPRPEGIP